LIDLLKKITSSIANKYNLFKVSINNSSERFYRALTVIDGAIDNNNAEQQLPFSKAQYRQYFMECKRQADNVQRKRCYKEQYLGELHFQMILVIRWMNLTRLY